MSQNTSFIPYTRHHIDDKDIQYVNDALQSNYLTTGPYVKKFEQAIQIHCHSNFALSCSNGTSALMLSYIATMHYYNIAKGSGIIIPTITFCATVNTAVLCGLHPIFADVNPTTGLLDAISLEAAYRQAKKQGIAVKIVTVVHLNGQTADMEELIQITKRNNCLIIEDAAHAIGSQYSNGQPVGNCYYSEFTCFSFHAAKTITTGEGGALTTNNQKLADLAQIYRAHGIRKNNFIYPHQAQKNEQPKPWHQELTDISLNYRLADINCALGLSQIEKLNKLCNIRQNLFDQYKTKLKKLTPKLSLIKVLERPKTGWHLLPILINFNHCKVNKIIIINKLLQYNIQTQVHYIPLHHHHYYQQNHNLPNSEEYYEKVLSIPLWPGMTDDNIDYIIDTLDKIIS